MYSIYKTADGNTVKQTNTLKKAPDNMDFYLWKVKPNWIILMGGL